MMARLNRADSPWEVAGLVSGWRADANVAAMIDAKATKPGAARDLLKALRGLLRFCMLARLRDDDPTVGVKLPRHRTDGFYSWMEADIATYREFRASGTVSAWFSGCCSTRGCGAPMWCASAANISATVRFMSSRKRPAARSWSSLWCPS